MTKLRDVNGIIYLQNKGSRAKITVRTTADERGKSLSLAVEELELMLFIPIEPVADMVDVKGEQNGQTNITGNHQSS